MCACPGSDLVDFFLSAVTQHEKKEEFPERKPSEETLGQDLALPDFRGLNEELGKP